MSGLRVLVFGAWDCGPGYPRADALLKGLERRGVEIEECRIALPYRGSAKRRLLKSPWLWPGYWLSLGWARRRARRALRATIASRRPDVILVPYPGHVVCRWVREVWKGPLVLDLFLSIFDTVVLDRAMVKSDSLGAGLLRRMDARACESADRILVDTPANADFTSELTGLPRSRFLPVPVSDPAEIGKPPTYVGPVAGRPLEVLFFGTSVPLHGLCHLLDALQRIDGVRLTLVGGSPADRSRAAGLPAAKVRLLDDFVDTPELHRLLSATHLVAGVFGTSPKADRVIPFKVMHALQMGRPVITGRTRAVCAEIRDGRDAVLVPPGDSRSLAAALERIRDEPRTLDAMALASRRLYERRFSLDVVGRSVTDACLGLLDSGAGSAASNPAEVEVSTAEPEMEEVR